MKRRQFIQNVSFGAAALYANKLFPIAGKTKTLAVQLYTVREAVGKGLESTLEKLAALGYKNLEIYGYNGSFFGKTATEFKTILNNNGMKVLSSHHTSGVAMKSKGTLSEGWDKAIEDIHTLGAEFMVCAFLFPNERTEEHYKALPAMFEKAGTATKAAGIQFAYHNHDFEFQQKIGDELAMDYIIKNTSAELVKIELDLYWISKAGYDPVAYFEKYPGRFPLWHVKDMEAETKAITEVGNGTINFDKIFAAKKKAGMKYWFVEQDTSKRDMFESLKISRDYVVGKKY